MMTSPLHSLPLCFLIVYFYLSPFICIFDKFFGFFFLISASKDSACALMSLSPLLICCKRFLISCLSFIVCFHHLLMLCEPLYNNLKVNVLYSFYFVASGLTSGSFCFSSNSICPSICISPYTYTVPLSIGNCPSGGRYGGCLENKTLIFSLSASFSIYLACFILFNECSPFSCSLFASLFFLFLLLPLVL